LKKIIKKLFYKFLRYQEIETNYEIVSLGSEYGNWIFIKLENLYNSTIISAGVGEDISFDIEFINLFKSKVVLVDPTPRAVDHLDEVIMSLGQSKTDDYIQGGLQKITSYNLEQITKENLVFYENALWRKSGKILKFYFPENDKYVSNTLIKKTFINTKPKYINVLSTDVKEIIEKEKIKELNLIKIDIEGAEINVISSMLRNKIYPVQILLEIDYIKRDTIYSIIKTMMFIQKILNNGYKLIKINNYDNYLFVRKEVFIN